MQGADFCRAYTELADSWLAGLLGAGAPGMALVAVGGYGRGDLCPGSDLDVLLIHTRKDRDLAQVKQLADQIWYPLWDAGLKLGHGVRSVKEALVAGPRGPRHGHVSPRHPAHRGRRGHRRRPQGAGQWPPGGTSRPAG